MTLPHRPAIARGLNCIVLVVCMGLAGCATPSLVQWLEQPAAKALWLGLRAYEDGQWVASERELQTALSVGLEHPQDKATAHKLLAFMQCASQRMAACEQSFKDAWAADRRFTLTKAEAGHPLWGPVYRKLAQGVAPR